VSPSFSAHPTFHARSTRTRTTRRSQPQPGTPAPQHAGTPIVVLLYPSAQDGGQLGTEHTAAVRSVLEQLAAGGLTVLGQAPPGVAGRQAGGPLRPDPRRATAADTVLRVDARSRSVSRAGQEITLCRLEFDLLLHLARHPGQVFSRGQLLNAVWGYTFTGTRTVDVHVRRLRQKLGSQALVTTVRGVGYRLATTAPVLLRPDGAPVAGIPADRRGAA
jgi:two-component system OmpR family response regulator